MFQKVSKISIHSRPGPRPIKPRFQIPILAKLGLVEMVNSPEQEINYGFSPDEDSKNEASEKLSRKPT